jgi:predicted transcriptional regulator YheO
VPALYSSLDDLSILELKSSMGTPGWLSPYVPVVEAVVALLHPHVEAVVHDTGRDQVLAIWNPVSGRRPGHRSLLEPELLSGLTGDVVLGPYQKVDERGRRFTSVSVPIADGKGLLCLNFDRSVLDDAVQALTRFAAAAEPRPAALFERDWREQVNLLVDQWCRSAQVSRDRLTAVQRAELIGVLDGKGVFDMRHAAAHVAAALGVSRATVYNLLKTVRRDQTL